ncbi:MAG: hypothetical protein IPI34_03525 [bacterium]|nr:hypothetical protein [bacterium]
MIRSAAPLCACRRRVGDQGSADWASGRSDAAALARPAAVAAQSVTAAERGTAAGDFQNPVSSGARAPPRCSQTEVAPAARQSAAGWGARRPRSSPVSARIAQISRMWRRAPRSSAGQAQLQGA